MNLKNIKQLATDYSANELYTFADELEAGKTPSIKTHDDPVEQMNDYLQAAEVRKIMDSGSDLNTAVREFSKRVRSSIN